MGAVASFFLFLSFPPPSSNVVYVRTTCDQDDGDDGGGSLTRSFGLVSDAMTADSSWQ